MLICIVYFASPDSVLIKLLETWYFVLIDTIESVKTQCPSNCLSYLTEEYWIAKTHS